MLLHLRRTHFREDGVFGELTCDSDFFLFTLEHSYPNPNMQEGGFGAKLPSGNYTCKRGKHKLEDGIEFETFEIIGVTGHYGILFHIGNYNKDSDGCILIGCGLGRMTKGGQMITSSKQAFKMFIDLLSGLDEFDLIVTELNQGE